MLVVTGNEFQVADAITGLDDPNGIQFVGPMAEVQDCDSCNNPYPVNELRSLSWLSVFGVEGPPELQFMACGPCRDEIAGGNRLDITAQEEVEASSDEDD